MMGFANTTTKNNLKIKSRARFMSSYKDIELKHNLQEHTPNPKIKKMSPFNMNVLKQKLQREQKTLVMNYVLGISFIIVVVLFLIVAF